MADFLGARLSDWPCVEHAAIACLSLINSPAATREAGVGLLRRFATTVQVPPLARPERQAALTLWLALVSQYGTIALLPPPAPLSSSPPDLDLIDVSLTAIDGEKDPRCLLLAFQIIQQVAAVYHSPKIISTPLQSRAEEIIDTLSCYWPIKFTPPKNDPHGITRQDLEGGIEAAMASSPFLAPYAIPLILEKLSSTHRPAKHDALSAISLCCSAYGKEALLGQPDSTSSASAPFVSNTPYSHSPLDAQASLMSKVWSGLRNELLSPCDPEIFSTGGGAVAEELSSRLETAGSALTCLSSCLDSLGGDLTSLIIEDSSVGRWIKTTFQSLSNEGAGSSPAACARFSCVTSILTSVASSSHAGLDLILNEFLPLALRSITIPPSSPPPSADQPYLSSHIHGLHLIGMLAKILSKCNRVQLDTMTVSLEDMIRRTAQELNVFGSLLDKIPPQHTSEAPSSSVNEATLVYCYAWTNLLSLSRHLLLDQAAEGSVGQAGALNQNLLHPSIAHSLATRLAKWTLTPPSQDLSFPDSVGTARLTSSTSSFGSLLPPLSSKPNGAERLPSSLVKSHVATISSPPLLLPLQQAALNALSTLLLSNLGGGGCLTLTDRVLDEIMTSLASPQCNKEATHQFRSQSLVVASALSSNPGLIDLGWALKIRWRDSILGPLASQPPSQDMLMISSNHDEASEDGARFQLELSKDLLQCLATSILPILVSSPTSKDERDEWKLQSAASFASYLLESLSAKDLSAQGILKDMFTAAASCIGQCVAIAGRSTNQIVLLGNLASSVIHCLINPSLPSPQGQGQGLLLIPSLCSVITSLPPSLLSLTLSESSLKASLLTCLVKHAADESYPYPPSVGLSSSVAIASLIVKASDEEVAAISSLILESLRSSNDSHLSPEALRTLSWTCRALLMRKNEMSLGIIDQAIMTLSSTELQGDTLKAKEASALLFGLLVSDSNEVALSSYGRPLWRQRSFNLCLGRLVKADSDPSSDHKSLSLALCHLMGACVESQPQLLIGAASTAGPALSLSLEHLSTLEHLSSMEPNETLSSLPSALQGGLDALVLLLGLNTPTRSRHSGYNQPWAQAGSHLQNILPSLSRLVSFAGAPGVREVALRALSGIMAASTDQQDSPFPYQAIHPHRTAVLRAVKVALDDAKRAVRKAAIDCNKVWGVRG